MAAILCSMGGCTNFFVDDDIVKEMKSQLKSETANPLPMCPGYWHGGAQPQDANQMPPADKGKHAPSKKPSCQSIIGCNDTGLFLKKAAETKKEKEAAVQHRQCPKGKFDCCIFSKHALPPSEPLLAAMTPAFF